MKPSVKRFIGELSCWRFYNMFFFLIIKCVLPIVCFYYRFTGQSPRLKVFWPPAPSYVRLGPK